MIKKIKRIKSTVRKEISLDQFSPEIKFISSRDLCDCFRDGGIIWPIAVQFNLTNYCSDSCLWCCDVDRRMKNKTEMGRWEMPKELVIRILKEMAAKGLKTITFEGGGEPTLHPEFKEIILFAKKLGLKIGLVTNGRMLFELNSFFGARHFQFLSVSVDAATSSTREKIHNIDNFDDIIEGIKKIRRKDPGIVIGYSFVIAEPNKNELYQAAGLAKRIGCNYIKFKPRWDKKTNTFFELDQVEVLAIEKAKNLISDNFKVFSGRLEGDFKNRKFNHCFAHNFITHVGVDSSLYICCYLPTLKTEDGKIGDLKNTSFEKLWTSQKRKSLIKILEMDDEFVKNCPQCRFVRLNDLLANMKIKNLDYFL